MAKTINELLDEYRDTCYGNGFESGQSGEEGYPSYHYEDETTPRLAILDRFKEMEEIIKDLRSDLDWLKNKHYE